MSGESSGKSNELLEVKFFITVSVSSTSSLLNPSFISWSDGVVLLGSEVSKSSLELISIDSSVVASVNHVEDVSKNLLNTGILDLGLSDSVVSSESQSESSELSRVKWAWAIGISSSGSSSDPSSVGSSDGVTLSIGVVNESSSEFCWLDFTVSRGINLVEDGIDFISGLESDGSNCGNEGEEFHFGKELCFFILLNWIFVLLKSILQN